MSVTLNVNGTGYIYPQNGDENWGDGATNWAVAVTNGMLQKAGGNFTLTANVNFGGSFGLISKYYVSRGTNPAATGEVRLANTETVSWRNAANSADLGLSVDASDTLTFDGAPIIPAGGIFPTTQGGTGLGSYTAGDTIYYATGTAFTKLAIGSADTIMASTGSAPNWIASLVTTQGGTGVTSYTAGDLSYYASGTALSKLAIGANHTVMVSTGSAPSWSTSLALASTISASNLSGTNSGDVTLTAVGSSPSANGATLSTQALTLQPADSTRPGLVNATTQSFGGAKTFTTSMATDGTVGVLGAVAANAAIIIRGTTTLSGSTDQYGILAGPTFSSAATGSSNGVYAAPNTAAAAFTTAYRASFFSDCTTKGSGSTITRDIGIFITRPNQGTNNASIADNILFTGDYFINSTTTNASLFTGIVNFAGGFRAKFDTSNTANPPTKAQITSAFGSPATVGTGFFGVIDDNAAHTNEYVCWSDGTEWFYVTGTKAA